jgi:hypothetical protein
MRLLFYSAIAACLCGCRSSGGDSPTAALATTTAIVATIPLAPVAGVYHAVSGDIRKEKTRTLALHAQYDPVYAARIQMLSKRDPVMDAREAFAHGDAVLLPYTRRLPLGRDESSLTREFRELMAAVITDPLDQNESRWNSETYRHFMKVASAYRIAFNQEMTRLKEEPNQSSQRNAMAPPISEFEYRSSRG